MYGNEAKSVNIDSSIILTSFSNPIRNWVTCGNEAKSVNIDSPIILTSFSNPIRNCKTYGNEAKIYKQRFTYYLDFFL